MTQQELAETIARETVDALIATVARQSPKHVAAYESRRGRLEAMILSAGAAEDVIYNLKGNAKFGALGQWAKSNPTLMAAYMVIGKEIEQEVK